MTEMTTQMWFLANGRFLMGFAFANAIHVIRILLER